MCSSFFLQLVVSLSVAMDVECGSCRAPRNEPLKDSESRQWLGRMETYWGRLDQRRRSESAVAFIEYLVDIGQYDSALMVCKQIEPTKQRRHALMLLTGSFASYARVPEARYVAHILEREAGVNGGEEGYTGALSMIATMRAYQSDFDGAATAIRELDGLDHKFAVRLWYRLARIQASRGFCDEAMVTLERVHDREFPDDRQETLKEIAEHRAAKTKKRIENRPDGVEGYLAQLRSLAGVFSEPSMSVDKESLQDHETRASSSDDPIRKASLWRQIAWEHWRAGSMDGWGKAIEHCRQAVAEIPEALGLFRAVQYALLADLCFATGDEQAAVDLARMAGRASDAEMFGKALGSFTSGPLVISVLVRADAVPFAFEIAKRKSSNGTPMWLTLGAMCAFCNRLDGLAKQMEGTEDNTARAALCLGVAYGLCKKGNVATGKGWKRDNSERSGIGVGRVGNRGRE